MNIGVLIGGDLLTNMDFRALPIFRGKIERADSEAPPTSTLGQNLCGPSYCLVGQTDTPIIQVQILPSCNSPL